MYLVSIDLPGLLSGSTSMEDSGMEFELADILEGTGSPVTLIAQSVLPLQAS